MGKNNFSEEDYYNKKSKEKKREREEKKLKAKIKYLYLVDHKIILESL